MENNAGRVNVTLLLFIVIIHNVQNSKSPHDSTYKTDIDTRLWKQKCRNADMIFLGPWNVRSGQDNRSFWPELVARSVLL